MSRVRNLVLVSWLWQSRLNVKDNGILKTKKLGSEALLPDFLQILSYVMDKAGIRMKSSYKQVVGSVTIPFSIKTGGSSRNNFRNHSCWTEKNEKQNLNLNQNDSPPPFYIFLKQFIKTHVHQLINNLNFNFLFCIWHDIDKC